MVSFDENNTREYEAYTESTTSERVIQVTNSQRGRRHDDPENRPLSNPFLLPFYLIFAFAFIELFTGIWSNSLALLSDAWHMFSDVFAIGLAMFAFKLSAKSEHTTEPNKTKNNRFELNASIINAVLMFAVIAWISYEAWQRLANPASVQSDAVILVALIGLIINLFVAKHLHQHNPNDHAHHHAEDHQHAHQHLNHHAAFLHVIGDLLGSVAALVSGIVIYMTGWSLIDPILSLVIAGLLLIGTINLCRNIFKAMS